MQFLLFEALDIFHHLLLVYNTKNTLLPFSLFVVAPIVYGVVFVPFCNAVLSVLYINEVERTVCSTLILFLLSCG